MAFNGQKVLCVVPARGGSKSIPRKNLAKVCGTSLIGHVALTLQELSWIDVKLLSTDDEEIAKEGERYGLSVPFMRPSELASDTASSLEMWQHALLAAEKIYDVHFDISLLIEPTSPMRKAEDLERAVRCIVEDNCPAAVTVSRTPAHFTPQKTLELDRDGNLAYYIGSEGINFHTRQTIPTYYHRNGICYAVTRDYLMGQGQILEGAKPIVIDRPIVNIDEPYELELAGWLMQQQSD